MKTYTITTWSSFEKRLDNIKNEYGMFKSPDSDFKKPVQILYRGQGNKNWELKTTLERACPETFSVNSYLYRATQGAKKIESFTGRNWQLNILPEIDREIKERNKPYIVHLPHYDYLVYLRHHGFPSPLLDWTESPYIAAFFALTDSPNSDSALYCYIERPNLVKGGLGGQASITLMGPYVNAHTRHFAQKAHYSIATKWSKNENSHFFCNHEQIFLREDKSQDILIKLVLKNSLKQEAFNKLNEFNINHYTLFQSEDALIKSVAHEVFNLQVI